MEYLMLDVRGTDIKVPIEIIKQSPVIDTFINTEMKKDDEKYYLNYSPETVHLMIDYISNKNVENINLIKDISDELLINIDFNKYNKNMLVNIGLLYDIAERKINGKLSIFDFAEILKKDYDINILVNEDKNSNISKKVYYSSQVTFYNEIINIDSKIWNQTKNVLCYHQQDIIQQFLKFGYQLTLHSICYQLDLDFSKYKVTKEESGICFGNYVNMIKGYDDQNFYVYNVLYLLYNDLKNIILDEYEFSLELKEHIILIKKTKFKINDNIDKLRKYILSLK